MLQIKETYTNETRGHQFGGSDWYEPYTDNMKRLFRSLQKEYGRCVSSVYVDTHDGPQKVGWYFESKQEYEHYGRRTPDTYIRGVWVEYRTVEEEEADA